MTKREEKSEGEIWGEIWSKKSEKEEMAPLRMKEALELLGSPQSLFAPILLWGEGKESSRSLLDSLLQTYGVGAGVFCSGAKDLKSAIKVRGESPSSKRISDLYGELTNFLSLAEKKFEKEGLGKMGSMEVLLCLSALEFSDEPVDVAMFEVPKEGFEEIFKALDPSGLILTSDPSSPLPTDLASFSPFIVSLLQREEEMESLREVAEEAGACLLVDGEGLKVSNDLLAVGGQVADLTTPRGLYPQVPIKLFGEFEAHLSLLSLSAAERLLSEGKLEEDLVSEAFSTVKVPGSLKVEKSDPLTLSSSAASPFKTDLCLSALEETFHPSSLVVVLAAGKDFDPASLKVLEGRCDLLIVTQIWGGKTGAEAVFSSAGQYFDSSRLLCIPDFSSALKKGRETALGQDGGCVLVTGGMEAVRQAEKDLS
ncbi:MAG: hypothetical protein IIY10_03130 [Aeriscardovia sp.]|nr:hypothetical protein [Aeriscardovia sp.]